VRFKGRAFGDEVRIEFEIMSLGGLRIEDLTDFDLSTLKLELRPTASGILVVGVWEGKVEESGKAIKAALEESKRLRERVLERIKSRTEHIRRLMIGMGFKEEVVGYGNALKFTKEVGGYEMVVTASTLDNRVRVEVYGDEGKILSPEMESMFENVELEEMEAFDIDGESEERLVINLEIPDNDRSGDQIVNTIKTIENLLMM